MKKIKIKRIVGLSLAVGILVGAYLVDSKISLISSANAAGGEVKSPTGVAPDRYV